MRPSRGRNAGGGHLEEAGNTAFNRLFRYISGGNRSREKVAMTAPVSQQPQGEKIAMTAPVAEQRVREHWAVSFMMPAAYTLETLPVPEDPQVTLRQVPARRMAAVRYSGSWSEKGTSATNRNWRPGCAPRASPARANPVGPLQLPVLSLVPAAE